MELGFVVAFVSMLLGMTVVFGLVYSRTGSIRKGVLAALVLGKAWALSMYLLGLDRPVIRFYLVNKRYPWVHREIVITANQLIFLAYLSSFILIVALPIIVEEVPELRRLKEKIEL